ncbi:hypothetical protein VNI00_013474 [Paramarasmius palmivorus]|uniref:Uncharacterized protein n=1 Tax=Paramarasmius palmivorus TaxID=297713 RepID=A0AAW0BZ29_9AGAR
MSSGGVCTITEDTQWIVASVNASYVPKPLFGTRRVSQRLDYYFGEDDPLLYPQPYLQERCHWSVIPRKPLDPEHARAKWWAILDQKDFHEVACEIAGFGRWKEEALEQYKGDYLLVKARVKEHCTRRQQSKKAPNLVVTVLSGQLESVLGFLRNTTLPFNRARQLLRCFQRWYLELTAALDWCDVFRPFMDGQQKVPPTSLIERVGAFTVKSLDYHTLHRAGIPVWQIRSIAEQESAKSHRRIPFTTPEELNIEKELLDDTRWIYEGVTNTLSRAVVMENYLRDFCSPPDPFAAPATEPATNAKLPSSLPARPAKNGAEKRHQPYKKGPPAPKAKQSEIPRDKFAEIHSPHTPPTPEFWIRALAGIDRTKRPKNDAVVNSGYIFPDPGLFTSSTGEKLQRLVRTWLNLRLVLITRLMMRPPCLASVAWYPKQWRILLLTDSETHPSHQGTFMYNAKEIVNRMLGACLKDYGVNRRTDVSVVKEFQFTWRGKTYPIGFLNDERLLKEVIWEIYELNFRTEFEALDNILRGGPRGIEPVGGPWVSMYQGTTLDDVARLQDVHACLPHQGNNLCSTSLWWPQSSQGVAASSAVDRAPWILCMKHVLKGWPGSRDIHELHAEHKCPEQLIGPELERLEEAVARFYCQSFFNTFGRPPIIPHRLDEILPGDVINW